jgi:hypothetical protein
MAVPVHLKLRWLEEMGRFFNEFMSPAAKRVDELLRRGEL